MADKYLVGGSSTLWSDGGNWSLTSGGAGGAGKPGFSEVAIMDVNSPTSDTFIEVVTGTAGIRFSAGYAGRIVHNPSLDFTVGAMGWVQESGQFIGSNSTVRITAPTSFSITGGFFQAPSTSLDIIGDIIISDPGYFDANGGTVRLLTGINLTLDVDNVAFNNIFFQVENARITVLGTFLIKGLFEIDEVGGFYNGVVRAEGDVISREPSANEGFALLELAGAGSHTIDMLSGIGRGDVVVSQGLWVLTADMPLLALGQDVTLSGTGILCVGPYTLEVQGDLSDNSPSAHIQRFQYGSIIVHGANTASPVVVEDCGDNVFSGGRGLIIYTISKHG